LALLLIGSAASAHKPSDSYLKLRSDENGVSGRWDIALRDLDDVLDLDQNADREVTWGELRRAAPRIETYARASLTASNAGGPCRVSFGEIAVIAHSDGSYAALPLRFGCTGRADRLRLHYQLLFDRDAQHRGVVQLEDGAAAPIVLTKSRRELALELAPAPHSSLLALLRLGIEHICQGYDHLLFLLALLLPAVLRRDGDRWLPAEDFRTSLSDIARIVTAFTLAHSLTLGLAAAGWIALSPRFVESAIALSVVLAALNNLFPLVKSERWLAAFSLGLLHGFGFAATLADAGTSGSSFGRTLLGFNLGVELGQLAVVLLLLPILFGLRRSPRYPRLGLGLGSSAVLLVSAIWLVERAFDVRIIS
jgi:hypothetical protein